MKVELSQKKVKEPCTYKQVCFMRSFDSFETSHNNSQIMKYLSFSDASEVIDTLQLKNKVVLS